MSTKPGTALCNSTKPGGLIEGATGGRPIVSMGVMGIATSGIGAGATGPGMGIFSSTTTSGNSSGIGCGIGCGTGRGVGAGTGLGCGIGGG